MIVELKMKCDEFADMLRKMAVPTSDAAQPYLFPNICPTLKNVGSVGILEWIVKDEVTAWVRIKYPFQADLNEPVKIPMNAAKLLQMLKVFSSADTIHFIHDEEAGIDTLTTDAWDDREIVTMPIFKQDITLKTFDGFPAPLAEGEVMMLKGGTVEMDIAGSVETKFFEKVFSNAVAAGVKKSNKEDVSVIYTFIVDESKTLITAFAGDAAARENNSIKKELKVADLKGNGDLHYTNYLESVVGILNGRIKFHSTTRGPMWIMQDTDTAKVRYLVPPAALGTYK